MAAGLASDFKPDTEQIWAGYTEVIEQQTDIFNQSSNGAIVLVDEDHAGAYVYKSFLQAVSGIVARRDVTSLSAVADTGLTMEEEIFVKLKRKIIPLGQTLDAWKNMKLDPSMMSFLIGQQVAKAIMKDYVDSVLRAAGPALYANLPYDRTAGSMRSEDIISGMALFGDAASKIACWVMHSTPYFALVKDQYADAIANVADVAIYKGTPATLGKPVVVCDSPGLVNASPTPDQYYTLGLVEGALIVQESEKKDIVSEIVTGLENLVNRIQGEYAFSIGVKGFQYDVANGGANPNDAALITATNWDLVSADDKSTAGFCIQSQ